MKFVLLVCLSSVSVVDAPESKVIGSHEPVKATVGDDVILPCHLDPPFDVNALTVEWKCSKTFVHVFRNKKDDPALQDKNFRGRTSLFYDELIGGNISLKLTNVTEQDAGNYTCFVPKLISQVRRGFIQLIVEPAGERNEENPTKNQTYNLGLVTHPSTVSTHDLIIITALFVVAAILVCLVSWICPRRHRTGRQEGHEQVPMADNIQKDLRDVEG